MSRAISNVLVDHWSTRRRLALDLMWVVGFSLLTALAAQIAIPLPFSPVPLTGQTFAVLLSGAVLGCRRGFFSQVTYLAEGAAGLPVFAAGGSALHLIGPTAGYLWSYPLAAALAGWCVERGASRSVAKLAGALGLANAVILSMGAIGLHALLGMPYRQAFLLGVQPFWVGDTVKIALVAVSLPAALKWSGERGASPADGV